MNHKLPTKIVAVLVACYVSLSTNAQNANELIKRVRSSFVFFGQGSGVLISENGLVVTNAHVLSGNKEEFKVRLGNGKAFIAKLLGKDEYGDLALLKLKTNEKMNFLPMCNPKKVKLGSICLAIGNPFAIGLRDNQPSFTVGVVSGTHQLHERYSDAIITDAPINPGNSGGPLINVYGELIGINGMINPSLGLRSNTGLAFAIPVNQIKNWIPILKKCGDETVYHGAVFGLTFKKDDVVNGSGATVESVNDNAKKLGFAAGDVITAVNEYDVWSPLRFVGIIGTYPENADTTVTVMRGDKKEKCQIKFKLPAR